MNSSTKKCVIIFPLSAITSNSLGHGVRDEKKYLLYALIFYS